MDWTWNALIPKKITISMWKSLHQRLPLDDCVRTLGIHVVSSCNCCTNRKEETLYHVKSTCKLAAYILKQAAVAMGIFNVQNETWIMKITHWFGNSRMKTHIGRIIGLSPIIIT